jgi:hypothetical protein
LAAVLYHSGLDSSADAHKEVPTETTMCETTIEDGAGSGAMSAARQR